MQKNQNRRSGLYGLFVCIVLNLALFAHAAPVFTGMTPSLTADMDVATAGYYRLNWEAEAANSGDEFVLRESTTENSQNPKVISKGPDLASVIGGKSDGTYFYRVRRAQPDRLPGIMWTDAVNVKVEHHSLSKTVFLSRA